MHKTQLHMLFISHEMEWSTEDLKLETEKTRTWRSSFVTVKKVKPVISSFWVTIRLSRCVLPDLSSEQCVLYCCKDFRALLQTQRLLCFAGIHNVKKKGQRWLLNHAENPGLNEWQLQQSSDRQPAQLEWLWVIQQRSKHNNKIT